MFLYNQYCIRDNMYNTDFSEQLERFRDNLFGTGCLDVRKASDEAHKRYFLPNDIELLDCAKNDNGEYIPVK